MTMKADARKRAEITPDNALGDFTVGLGPWKVRLRVFPSPAGARRHTPATSGRMAHIGLISPTGRMANVAALSDDELIALAEALLQGVRLRREAAAP